MNISNNLNINNKYKVLIVCLGNICRSPAAQGIFEHIFRENGIVLDLLEEGCGNLYS